MARKNAFKWILCGAKPQATAILSYCVSHSIAPHTVVCPSTAPVSDQQQMGMLSKQYGIDFYITEDLHSLPIDYAALDTLITCRFEKIPESIFSLPKRGCFNIHSSPLPAYRGTHPVHWAIANGETIFGISSHKLSNEIDQGELVSQTTFTTQGFENYWLIQEHIDRRSPPLVLDLLESLRHNTAPNLKPSSHTLKHPTFFARRRQVEDSRLEWSRTADDLINLSRALPPPYPKPYFFKGDQKIECLNVQTSNLTESDHAPGTIIEALSKRRYCVATANHPVVITTNHPLDVGFQLT